MKFLYKIHSSYDGFYPRRISARMIDGKNLRLGWRRYIDVVELGDEVWVYFHGPHKFENGVYVKGLVSEIDTDNLAVFIRVREFREDQRLTDAATSLRVADAVRTRNVQVFLLPQEWAVAPECKVNSDAESCRMRLCEHCETWQGFPVILNDACAWPARLSHDFEGFAPAYWVIPSRCYLHSDIARPVRRTSELFYRFKMGEEALAHPLALGMYEALRDQGTVNFDCIVPIPLSPDKEKAGEIHRTRILARELGGLLGVKVAEVLSLSRPISKRRLLNRGFTPRQFEIEYSAALEVADRVADFDRILLVDDVCTQGTTLGCALRRIREVNAECELLAATAGQMIIKAVVTDEGPLRA